MVNKLTGSFFLPMENTSCQSLQIVCYRWSYKMFQRRPVICKQTKLRYDTRDHWSIILIHSHLNYENHPDGKNSWLHKIDVLCFSMLYFLPTFPSYRPYTRIFHGHRQGGRQPDRARVSALPTHNHRDSQHELDLNPTQSERTGGMGDIGHCTGLTDWATVDPPPAITIYRFLFF